jgi:hypothetical protein
MAATLALAKVLAIQNPAYRPTDTPSLLIEYQCVFTCALASMFVLRLASLQIDSNAVEINAVSRLIKHQLRKANRSLTLIGDIPLIVA